VFNAAGIRVPAPGGQKFWSNVAIGNGQTSEFTWAWTAPATPGTYTVKLGVFDPVWTSPPWHWKDSAATISVGTGGTFQPSFRVGDGANSWWIEVYTSDDVTGMDVIGGNGRFYLPLTKRSWGAWAGTAPSELASGDLVQFVARRSTDGSSAASANFGWLTTQGPATTPGWSCTFSIGTGASTSRVEVNTSTAAVAVEVKAGTGTFTALTKETTTRWAKAMTVPAGTKVIFRAKSADNAWAYSTVYNWLQ